MLDMLYVALRRAASCAVRAIADDDVDADDAPPARGKRTDDDGAAALLCNERRLTFGNRARALRAAAMAMNG